MEGVEPSSKQGTPMVSTCLFRCCFSCRAREPPCCRSADKAIPKLLSTPGSGRNQESPPAGCLVRPPCERIKPVIYCASIRQRERSCFRQLIFCSQDLRASLRGSTCLHDNSSCCQNHTSPQRTDCKSTANFQTPQVVRKKTCHFNEIHIFAVHYPKKTN